MGVVSCMCHRMKWHFNKKSSQKLRLKQLGGHDVHVVEGNNPKSLALLARAYKDVYEAAFPQPEERESLATWLANLKEAKQTKSIISILGDNLDTDHPTIKSLTVGYYYEQQDVGLLAYIATAPHYQGQGLGRVMNEANTVALVQHAQDKGTQIKGIFFEVNDPAKIKPEDDVMDPAKRIAMYQKWGAIMLPIDYIQPPLEKGVAKCETLKLMAYINPVTGQYPSKDAIKAYITGIYTELASFAGCAPKDNPDYIKIIKQIDAMQPLPPLSPSGPKPPKP
jgi:GNAT superfamily N-acetyltransferase